MNVRIVTVDGTLFDWTDAAVTFDTTVLQVTRGDETSTFPLCNVIVFTTYAVTP